MKTHPLLARVEKIASQSPTGTSRAVAEAIVNGSLSAAERDQALVDITDLVITAAKDLLECFLTELRHPMPPAARQVLITKLTELRPQLDQIQAEVHKARS